MISSAVTKPRRQAGEGLIYASSTSGHRQSYLTHLGGMFGLESVSGRLDRRLFNRLMAADSLLFASLDDHMPSFGAVAVARSLRRRPTVALFLRAQKCFETGRWYYSGKRQAFRGLKRLPFLTIASITPFAVAPRHREVANAGVYDPQYWDLHDGVTVRKPPRTALAGEVVARAAGRHVLCVLGTLSLNKGIAFLAETLARNPSLAEHILVVGAGHVPADAAPFVAKMIDAGALIVDRYVSDEELESLYGVAGSVWACYAPEYDQASGIFGRAVQLGVRPILRSGSISEAFAKMHVVDHIAVSYDDPSYLAEFLRDLAKHMTPPSYLDAARVACVAEWRAHFMKTVGMGLGHSGSPAGMPPEGNR